MKYDYFERNGAARLYRVPRGQQQPVQCVMGSAPEGYWNVSGSYLTRDALLNCPQVKGIVSAERAKEISDGAPVDVASGPRYFYNGSDLYRLTGIDTFHYWSAIRSAWYDPVTSGHQILGYDELAKSEAKSVVPEAFGLTKPEPVAVITSPGKLEVSLKYNPETDASTFTLTRCS